MKKTKNEKGITLVALIITVVVLLILVSVAINSIQNDGILSYAGNVANKYNQAQKDEQSVLDSYLGYLKGEQWVTVYEGRETTVDGFAVIANKHLFKAGRTYKITVESAEFEGTVETKAILLGAESGQQYYMLFGVTEGQAVTANSLTEYRTILENLPEDAIYSNICGVNISDSSNGNSSAIAKIECTSLCEYTVTKIEEKVEAGEDDGFLIFKGEVEVPNGLSPVLIEDLNGVMLLTKKYKLDLIVNGVETTVYTGTRFLWGGVIHGQSITVNSVILLQGEGTKCYITTYGEDIEACIITAIYEVGDSDTYVEENGFGVMRLETDNWNLVKTPNTDYIVPTTVAGKTISTVFLDCIQGSPTFEHFVTFGVTGEAVRVTQFKITHTNLSEVSSMLDSMTPCLVSYGYIIDLTECGNNLEFSSVTLEKISLNPITLYVTSAVKANYQDNANIIVPQS